MLPMPTAEIRWSGSRRDQQALAQRPDWSDLSGGHREARDLAPVLPPLKGLLGGGGAQLQAKALAEALQQPRA